MLLIVSLSSGDFTNAAQYQCIEQVTNQNLAFEMLNI